MSEDNHKNGYFWMGVMLTSQDTLTNVVNEVMEPRGLQEVEWKNRKLY
jgi:hypothetical protein